MSKVTVSQAAKLTGKSRETINKDTKSGKLSFSHNARNHKVIDIAELERVYPLTQSLDDLKQTSTAVSASPQASDSDASTELATLRERLAASQQTNELLSAERERERRQLESEIENLRSSLEKAQEQHSKALLLITDQSKSTKDRVAEWEESISKLEARLRKQEETAKQQQQEISEKAKKKIAALQQDLENAKSRNLLQRLFG